VEVAFYSSEGWESWGLPTKPVIPEGMAFLVDEDLLFVDENGPRATAVANEWLRLRPTENCPAPSSWGTYARILRDWIVAAQRHGVEVFDTRDRMKALLSTYAVDRSSGDPKQYLGAVTWNQHMSVLGAFYRWAVDEQCATAVPFTYRQGVTVYMETACPILVNHARRRVPHAHVTIKHLEDDFAAAFVNGLAGLRPDGSEEEGPGRFRGRHLARNGAVGDLVFSSGLRLQEFTYVLACEIPPLPSAPQLMPIAFPLPEKITKGSKFRVTWTSYTALARVHSYLGLERMLTCEGSLWRPPRRWGEPLLVSEMNGWGGRVNGSWVSWRTLGPGQRRRLVAQDGGSMLLATRSDGGPFTAWSSLFKRTSDRIRRRFEPRFPHVHPHYGRHTFAMSTMERLVAGFYEQAARLSAAGGGADGALAHYLTTTEPLLVLRDLLGHSSVLTTEKYLKRLDMLRAGSVTARPSSARLLFGRYTATSHGTPSVPTTDPGTQATSRDTKAPPDSANPTRPARDKPSAKTSAATCPDHAPAAPHTDMPGSAPSNTRTAGRGRRRRPRARGRTLLRTTAHESVMSSHGGGPVGPGPPPCVRCCGRCRRGLCVEGLRGLTDHIEDEVRMREHGNVAAVHGTDVGAHALGGGPLQVGVHGVVVVGDDVPAWLCPPGGAGSLLVEQVRHWHSARRQDELLLRFREVAAEVWDARGLEPHAAVSDVHVLEDGCAGEFVLLFLRRLVLVWGERGDVHQSADAVVGARFGDQGPTVGVTD